MDLVIVFSLNSLPFKMRLLPLRKHPFSTILHYLIRKWAFKQLKLYLPELALLAFSHLFMNQKQLELNLPKQEHLLKDSIFVVKLKLEFKLQPNFDFKLVSILDFKQRQILEFNLESKQVKL